VSDARGQTGARQFTGRRTGIIVAAALLIVSTPSSLKAFPIHGSQTVLPDGSELNEDALQKPREIFKSESIGKSYLINLGDLAFSSPNMLGDVARRAGVSCSTCHVNGASIRPAPFSIRRRMIMYSIP
jgi:hypothetical protein